ncbi:MAG: Gfo/Idh/MocA family oxidoreductase [Clostridia bacterium]|nr:Gfo/Idh/MocA family oxidoreductase [Clostridia bacterium]
MKKLRGAIIGLGGISRGCHIPAWKKMDFVEIVAVCDIVPEKIDSYKKQFNLPDALGFTDYKDVLEIEGLDFVDICTPNLYHSVIAVDALEKGINVFCEKPDAVSVEEALKMKNAAEKAGKTLMVMRNNRHRNTSRYMKKFIADGKMGDIYCGRCGWQRRRGIPGKGGWFTTKELSGGGPLIDLGVHMIDLSIWLMGNPTPVAVSGCTFRKFADSDVSDSANSSFGDKVSGGTFDVEDLAMGFIKFDNGACLQIEFSWASNVERENLFVELRGTKAGSKFIDYCNGTNSLKVFTESNGVLENLEPQIVDEPNIHARNIEHFVDVIMNGAKPDFEPIQGVNMIKILRAMYESAETGKEVQL